MARKNHQNGLVQVTFQYNPDKVIQLDKMADRLKISRSELLRYFSDEGLKVNAYEENYDSLTRIIRQEVKSALNIDDFRIINTNNTERMIKVMIKLAKPLVANYLLHMCYLNEIAPPESIIERVTQSVKFSMEYMSDNDNKYFSDTDKLIKFVEQLL